MSTLSRDDILNALDLPTAPVHIPRWGGEVLVKAMPMASRRYLTYVYGSPDHRAKEQPSPEEIQVRRFIGTVILCALDPDTEEPMFKWDDADALREKHWNSVLAIATKAFELAGDGPDEEDEPEPQGETIEGTIEEFDSPLAED